MNQDHLATDNPWPENVLDASEAHDLIVRALYAGFNSSKAEEGTTPQEKIMAIALHYGDTLAFHKTVLQQAYELILCAPQHWPASHAWTMAGRWLQAVNLHTNTIKDGWRIAILLGMAHRIAQAWFNSSSDDDWLQSMDDIIHQSWMLMEGFSFCR